jgi:hypothetical protein
MAQRIPIYIPTFISDQNFNPNRVLPRLFFFNGMVECETFLIESGSLNTNGVIKEENAFPYFDHYNVVSGSFPTSGSNSLLFNNENPLYGQQPTQTLYTTYWSNYVELLYNPKTRLLTAKAIIPLADYFDMELNDIVNWRGNYYHLRAINEYNLKTGECQIQLLGPIIADTFGGINPFTTTTTTTTTTAAPASVKIHLEEYNASPTAFFDLNAFANGQSYFFSGDFTQSVAPNISIVEMEVAQNTPSQNWGPYLTASATMTITDNGSNIFNNTSTYTSGSATYSVTSSVNFQSGHTYVISASNQPLTTTTTTTTGAPSATLAWSYSETGGAAGEMVLYINGSAVETRSSTASGTRNVYPGDTIYVDLQIYIACSSGDTYANVYTTGNIINDADCANNSGVALTTGTYTVASGDIGSTLTLNTFASCDGGCL